MKTKPTYQDLEREVFELRKEAEKREQVEKTLRERERMLNETEMLAKVGGWEYQVAEEKFTWTDEVYRIYGVEKDIHDPGNISHDASFYAPEDRKTIETAFNNAVLKGVPYDLELGFISAAGEHIWVRTIGKPVFEDGKVTKVIGNIMDITDRKRATEMLLAERLKLERYFENIPLMAYNVSLDGRIMDCNKEAVKALEYESKTELLGKYAIPALYAKSSRKKAKQIFENWRKGNRIKNEELEVVTQKGRILQVLLNVDSVLDLGGTPIHSIATHLDITERKRALREKEKLQVRLQQAQKMDAIATLAGGIAHDYNNLLSVIMGNLSLSMETADPGSDLADFLSEANMASMKAKTLTHELMALAMGGAPEMEKGPLNGLLQGALSVVPDNSGITLEVSIPEDLWTVPHDPYKISAVFKNVIKNAVEAMPHGGLLSIGAQNLKIHKAPRELRLTLKPVNYVTIAIRDQGVGISENHLEHVFDPYFSTKDKGAQKGMGLGLATAYAIVEKHGGHIAIDSSKGKGTAVNIYLPVEKPETKVETTTEAKAVAPSKSQRVLVMDDEKMLRKLAQQMLTRLGYDAVTAGDGFEAIEIIRQQKESGNPLDIVILDLTIKGGMGGEQTVRELLKIDPNIKTVVSSGYYNDPVISQFKKYGFMESIAKPYEMKSLKEILEKLS